MKENVRLRPTWLAAMNFGRWKHGRIPQRYFSLSPTLEDLHSFFVRYSPFKEDKLVGFSAWPCSMDSFDFEVEITGGLKYVGSIYVDKIV